MKKVFTVLKLTLIVTLLASPLALHAQPGFEEDVTDTPIDGGITLLLIAGAGYGAKKLNERKTRHLNKEQKTIE